MYDELVKMLRVCGDSNNSCGNCPVRENDGSCPHGEWEFAAEKYMLQAADAIEELQSDNAALSGTVSNLIGQIADLSKPRWISVTERLPQEWWPVLGLIQFFDKEEPPAQQVLWYLGNGHWREKWNGNMVESDVTHWMPLPEPPKEET